MSPWILVGAGAAALFFLQQPRARTRKKPFLAPPKSFPLPPKPLPLPEGSEGNYSEQWDGLSYGVEVYPPGAGTSFPPPPLGGIIASPQCKAIAVSDGWWDEVGEYVKELTAEGGSDSDAISKMVVQQFVPTCKGKFTLAHQMLRAEVLERVTALSEAAPLEKTSVIGGGLSSQPTEGVFVSLGEGAQLRKRTKPEVGIFTAIFEPSNNYIPGLGQHVPSIRWRVWAPGPVYEGQEIASGAKTTFAQAEEEANEVIDNAYIVNPGKGTTPSRRFSGGFKLSRRKLGGYNR